MSSPLSAATMLFAARKAIAPRVDMEAEPMWGSTTQLLSVNKGDVVGRGSGTVTSKPAAEIVLDV